MNTLYLNPETAAYSENRFMRMKRVVIYTDISQATLYRMIDAGLFPKGKKLSSGTVVWDKYVIDSWLSDQNQEAK